MVTARSDEVDRVIGLELGADDYVTKPFSPREVIARVRALARRGGLTADAAPVLLRFDRLEVDEAAREVRVDGADIGLKPREFALLLQLASNPGVAFSRTALLQAVWGFDFDGDERTVDVHVRRLRAKLEMKRNCRAWCTRFTVSATNLPAAEVCAEASPFAELDARLADLGGDGVPLLVFRLPRSSGLRGATVCVPRARSNAARARRLPPRPCASCAPAI